jgi:hypothetical protein
MAAKIYIDFWILKAEQDYGLKDVQDYNYLLSGYLLPDPFASNCGVMTIRGQCKSI